MDLNIKPLTHQPRTLPLEQPSLKCAHLLGIPLGTFGLL